jgi:ubiquinone biosynthesis protein UbiJ
MKAAFIRRTGPPSVIEYGELPAPELHQGEALVRLKAAAVDPLSEARRAHEMIEDKDLRLDGKIIVVPP